jgi:hypothetical protein
VIADLGQAKAFNPTSSRATAMPGAFVYSAPEVLTGSYTPKIGNYAIASKIDILSFYISSKFIEPDA